MLQGKGKTGKVDCISQNPKRRRYGSSCVTQDDVDALIFESNRQYFSERMNIDKYSKVFFTSFEQVSLGEIYPKNLVFGIQSLDGFIYVLKRNYPYLFKCLSNFTDMKWTFLDGSIVRTHQHSAGAAILSNEA